MAALVCLISFTYAMPAFAEEPPAWMDATERMWEKERIANWSDAKRQELIGKVHRRIAEIKQNVPQVGRSNSLLALETLDIAVLFSEPPYSVKQPLCKAIKEAADEIRAKY